MIGEVQESVRAAGGEVRKPAAFERVFLIADPHLETTAQDVDGLVLVVVDVERRSTVRRDLAEEVVKRVPGVLAREFEHEISSWAGLEAESLVG